MRKDTGSLRLIAICAGLLFTLSGCGSLFGGAGTPVAIINASPISGAVPLVVHLDGSGSFAAPGSTLVRYQWDLGDGSQAQGSQMVHVYNQKGRFQVRLTVTDDRGRSGEAGTTVRVGDLTPHAAIIASPITGWAPLTVTFDGTGSSGPKDDSAAIVSYHWNFGDGTEADGSKTIHRYFQGGRYQATLTVTTDTGLMDRASAEIQALSFTKLETQRVGRSPVAAVAADLDGDGRLDLAVANIASNDISILIQQPDGQFSQIGNIPVRHAPAAIAIADFNEDGIPDLVSCSFETGEISLALGSGAGRFGPVRDFPATLGCTALAVGDFNNDGHLDLAVADGPGDRVALLLGDGKGGFAPPKYYPTGRWPSALVAGDFNGDGHLDLAVADFFSNTISILLGDGQGGFSNPVQTPVGQEPVALAAGDFNRDGQLDLAVADSGDGTLTILYGSSGGHFNQQMTIPVGNQVRAVAAADLNGDGHLDLIVANGGDDTFSVLLGDRSGEFPATDRRLFSAEGTPSGIAVGDFKRDGFPSIVIVRFGANSITLFANDL